MILPSDIVPVVLSDVAKWKVSGPVETLRTELAMWDLNRQEWQPTRSFTVVSFRPDGKVSTNDFHNADGSIAHERAESNFWMNDGPARKVIYSYDGIGRHVRAVQVDPEGTQRDSETCSYDAAGRKTHMRFLDRAESNAAYGVEGTDHAYGGPAATTMTVAYDERDLPAEVRFHDGNRNLVRQVIFTRDSAGRLLSEEMRLSGVTLGPVANLATVLGPDLALSSTTYAYDSKSRIAERVNRMGRLGEHRTTYRYDDHDNPIEETTEDVSREANLDEDGTVQYSGDRVSIQHTRFEYRYDAHGNWTERIVLIRVEPNPDFQPSNVERRQITYHTI